MNMISRWYSHMTIFHVHVDYRSYDNQILNKGFNEIWVNKLYRIGSTNGCRLFSTKSLTETMLSYDMYIYLLER